MRAGETEACSSDENAAGRGVNRSGREGQVYSLKGAPYLESRVGRERWARRGRALWKPSRDQSLRCGLEMTGSCAGRLASSSASPEGSSKVKQEVDQKEQEEAAGRKQEQWDLGKLCRTALLGPGPGGAEGRRGGEHGGDLSSME